MSSDSEDKKKPYVRCAATKVTSEQAKEFVTDRANCSDREATDLLESLRRELLDNER
jgi:hypothetical protein